MGKLIKNLSSILVTDATTKNEILLSLENIQNQNNNSTKKNANETTPKKMPILQQPMNAEVEKKNVSAQPPSNSNPMNIRKYYPV